MNSRLKPVLRDVEGPLLQIVINSTYRLNLCVLCASARKQDIKLPVDIPVNQGMQVPPPKTSWSEKSSRCPATVLAEHS